MCSRACCGRPSDRVYDRCGLRRGGSLYGDRAGRDMRCGYGDVFNRGYLYGAMCVLSRPD